MPFPADAACDTACPRCRAPMAALSLEAHYGQHLALDDCAGCRLSWFDAGELMRVSPSGWRTLLRHLAQAHAARLARPGPSAAARRARESGPRAAQS